MEFKQFAEVLANMVPVINDGLVLLNMAAGPVAHLTDPTGREIIKVDYSTVLVTDVWQFMSVTAYLIVLQAQMEVRQ